ncbi:MAG: hypothetical protein DYG99_12635 [Bacteroidetes bacterium CHB5]|nr:hypothetical protein [Bacteroidetes bacterium CHB5]
MKVCEVTGKEHRKGDGLSSLVGEEHQQGLRNTLGLQNQKRLLLNKSIRVSKNHFFFSSRAGFVRLY